MRHGQTPSQTTERITPGGRYPGSLGIPDASMTILASCTTYTVTCTSHRPQKRMSWSQLLIFRELGSSGFVMAPDKPKAAQSPSHLKTPPSIIQRTASIPPGLPSALTSSAVASFPVSWSMDIPLDLGWRGALRQRCMGEKPTRDEERIKSPALRRNLPRYSQLC